MIKLNIWRAFDQTRDGAVLQYTVNNGQTWSNIGSIQDGVNWYNSFQVQGLPGGQSIGWSNIKDNNWMEARHSLDVLKGKSKVQLRIAYGSDGTGITNNGIAFDNIWIGQRKKMVLIEHFTNASDSLSRVADSVINYIVNSNPLDAIDIQYHTSYPGDDIFYNQNPDFPNVRSYYYAVNQVPYSILNGGSSSDQEFDYLNTTPQINDIAINSLADPVFKINLSTSYSANSVNVDVTVTAQKQLSNSEVSLQTAVVENQVTGYTGNNGETVFESVLKTMLPDAAGTNYTKNWSVGDQEQASFHWNFKNVFDASELRVVAFIQDEKTKEVYQVTIDKNDLPTGTREIPIIKQDLKFMVFPNPAKENAYIRFNQPTNSTYRLEMYNMIGKLVKTEALYKGTEKVTLNCQGMRTGIYYIRITNGITQVGVSKLIISE